MKKGIFLLLLLQISLSAFSQETHNSLLTKEDYLKKSNSQNKAGWVLLGTGIGCIVGFANTFELNLNLGESASQNDNTLSTLFGVGGLASITGSIISFVSAGKNKRKAVSITLINEKLLLPMQEASTMKTQPAINVRLKL
jgi:hypothetical protein